MSLNLREMWLSRDLFLILVLRDIQLKYRQTLLGFAWALLVPLINMLVLGTIFGRMAKVHTDGLDPYVFYLAALVPWQYFASSLNTSSNSLVGNESFLTKIYLPRLFIPTSSCVANLVDFLLAFGLLLILMYVKHVPVAATIVLIPAVMVLAFLTASGVGMILSAVNVKYRDVRFVVPFLIQIWMYVTILIPFSMVPTQIQGRDLGGWRYAYALNPMVAVVEGTRWCLMHPIMTGSHTERILLEDRTVPETLTKNQSIEVEKPQDGGSVRVYRLDVKSDSLEPPWIVMLVGSCSGLMLFVGGLYYFKRLEKMFADIV